jgi:hypothetical protein
MPALATQPPVPTTYDPPPFHSTSRSTSEPRVYLESLKLSEA